MSAQERAGVAPGGILRAGLVEAPQDGVLFVRHLPDGSAVGVTADLMAALARAAGATLRVTVFPNTGAATEALRRGEVDTAFMPVDAARRAVLAFGPGYYALESTYLVTDATGVADVAGVDRPGMRVVAIEGTTTFRASARTLTRVQPEAVPTVAEALARMRDGRADAFALSRDTLEPLMAQVPATHIVAGGFQQTLVSIAVPQGRPEALAFVTAWLEQAKADGTVRRAFDAHGLQGLAVSP